MIIGLSGDKGTGKTLGAQYLEREYGFKRVSFATKLKDIAKLLFPFDTIHFSVAGKEKPYKAFPWTPREFLVQLGLFMRYWDEDYWVKALKLSEKDKVVIDDVRFPNEVEYIRSLGGKLIRIDRYPKLNIYPRSEDASERSLDTYKDWDFVIPDCRNIKPLDLYNELDNFMSLWS